MFDVGQAALGAVAAFLGACRLSAGFADRFERDPGGFVGLCQLRFRLRKAVGGRAARGRGGLDLADQGLTLAGELLRRVVELGPLGPRLSGALPDGGDLRGGVVLALVPGRALAGDRLQPAIRKLGIASDRLRFDTHLGKRRAVPRNVVVDPGEFGFEIGGGRKRGERFLSLLACGGRLIVTGAGPLPCLLKRRNPRRIAADLAFGGGMLLAGGIGPVLRLAPACAGLGLRRRCGGQRCFGRVDDAAGGVHFATGSVEFALDRLQPAAFGEPARRPGWGVCGDGKAVPAPEIPFAGHQPLARLEHRGKAWTVGAIDDADLS